MSHDAIDAVNPDNIGPEYNAKPALRGTVLADLTGQWFDRENGNAGAAEDAAAIKARFDNGRWSVVYVGENNFAEVHAALVAAGVPWVGVEDFPKVGAYLWAADPSGNIAKGTWQVPVTPVAVQDRDQGAFDLSTVDDRFPVCVFGYIDGPVSKWQPKVWARFAPVNDTGTAAPQPAPPPPPPPPPPPQPQEVNVILPLLQQGNRHPSVGVVQKLLGGLAVDDDFGPLTHQAVVDFQRSHTLVADGIVGQHTWGTLLGNPQ